MERLIGAVLPAFFNSSPVGFERTHVIVEPRFNEVKRDRGNLLVKSRVRYIEHLHLTNFRENYQNVRYIEV